MPAASVSRSLSIAVLGLVGLLVAGCASQPKPIGYQPMADVPTIPRVKDVAGMPQPVDLARFSIHTTIEKKSPVFYDGIDTQVFTFKVSDDVVAGDGYVIKKGSEMIAIKDTNTGPIPQVIRYRPAGLDYWTWAAGEAVPDQTGNYSIYLSFLCLPMSGK